MTTAHTLRLIEPSTLPDVEIVDCAATHWRSYALAQLRAGTTRRSLSMREKLPSDLFIGNRYESETRSLLSHADCYDGKNERSTCVTMKAWKLVAFEILPAAAVA
jgi:hypothetical protein